MKSIKNFGGLLCHGIPEFRLPREIIKEVIQKVLDLGVEVFLNKELGKDMSLDKLKEEYNAVLLCFGANISSKMRNRRRKFKPEYMEEMNF